MGRAPHEGRPLGRAPHKGRLAAQPAGASRAPGLNWLASICRCGPKQTHPSDDDLVRVQRWMLRHRLALVVVLVVLGAVTAVWQFWGGLPFAYSYSCSRAGQRTLESEERFARAHLPDAREFEVTTYDCDSGGPAFLSFTSTLAPSAARDALLTDRSCRHVKHDPDDGERVDCGTGRQTRYLFLGRATTGTAADLYIE